MILSIKEELAYLIAYLRRRVRKEELAAGQNNVKNFELLLPIKFRRLLNSAIQEQSVVF